MTSNTFIETVELLLSGKVLCEISHPEPYLFACEEANKLKIESHCREIGRTLLSTQDEQGYYLAYTSISNQSRAIQVSAQLDQCYKEFRVLVNWLRLVRNASQRPQPIVYGEDVSESSLLSAIEENQSLRQQLEECYDTIKIHRKASDSPKSKLRAMLVYLEKEGYFHLRPGSDSVYLATAKMSLLYEQLEFISSHIPQDDTEEENEEQLDMFAQEIPDLMDGLDEKANGD